MTAITDEKILTNEQIIENAKEERLKFISKTDDVANQIMDLLEDHQLGVSHLALTKALCFVLEATASKDKTLGVKFRNFSTSAINQMFIMKKAKEQPIVGKD
jgi:hypothetical protein